MIDTVGWTAEELQAREVRLKQSRNWHLNHKAETTKVKNHLTKQVRSRSTKVKFILTVEEQNNILHRNDVTDAEKLAIFDDLHENSIIIGGIWEHKYHMWSIRKGWGETTKRRDTMPGKKGDRFYPNETCVEVKTPMASSMKRVSPTHIQAQVATRYSDSTDRGYGKTSLIHVDKLDVLAVPLRMFTGNDNTWAFCWAKDLQMDLILLNHVAAHQTINYNTETKKLEGNWKTVMI